MFSKSHNEHGQTISFSLSLGRQGAFQFPIFTDALPNPIVITDTKARICYVNQAWTKLTGYTFDEIKGKNPRLISSGKTPQRVYKSLWKALSRGESFSTDEVIDKTKDGREYAIFSTYFSIKKKGKPLFYVQIQYDITESKAKQQKIKEDEEQLKLLLDTIEDYAIFRLDKNGRIRSWNKAAERLKGYKEKEILGKHYSIFYPDEEVKKGKPEKILKKVIKKGRYEERGGLRKRKDGSLFYASVIIVPIIGKRGAVNGFVKVTRDLTERIQLERQKDAFIGTASHELKTPITTLKGYSQVLEKRLQNDKNQQNLYLIRHIIAQTNRLTELVDYLLNVNYVESGKLALKQDTFNLTDVIAKLVSDFQMTVDSHTIIRDGEVKQNVIGDKHRVEQIFINLLTNAIKYSPQADKIMVHLATDTTYAVVSVQDFGFGILKEDQKHIFDKFFRTKEKEVGKIQGFGLGLHIASELAKRQGGKLWVESKHGKGSIFSFTIPLEN